MIQVSEDYMIVTFLKGEIDSERFGIYIKERLKKDNFNRDIIDNPSLENLSQNRYRRTLLGEYRGYDSKLLFDGFPDDFVWYKIKLNKKNIEQLKYINYSYWNELSGGTRLVKDAVKNIKLNIEIFGQSNRQFIAASKAVDQGKSFSEIILVAKDKTDNPVILEGHLRSTAYALSNKPELIIDAIIGFSKRISSWSLYR